MTVRTPTFVPLAAETSTQDVPGGLSLSRSEPRPLAVNDRVILRGPGVPRGIIGVISHVDPDISILSESMAWGAPGTWIERVSDGARFEFPGFKEWRINPLYTGIGMGGGMPARLYTTWEENGHSSDIILDSSHPPMVLGASGTLGGVPLQAGDVVSISTRGIVTVKRS